MDKIIWLIGSGGMSQDYFKVLEALKKNILVIGRGIESAKKFESATGKNVITGGLEKFLATNPQPCSHAIVSTGVEALAENTLRLLNYGIKNILVEKPAGLNRDEIKHLADLAHEKKANVYVAYNRRFYASVLKAQDIIKEDGGIHSFNFEFTEWSHVIENVPYAPGVKEKMFLANSTHVVDLAFFLGGKPQKIAAFTGGGLSWHPSASIFSGAGVSERGALFSYQANWESAGRWGVEMLTNKHRLIFRPMEKLQIQKRGSVAVDFVECNYSLDEEFKPGLFLQVKSFMDNENSVLCTIDYQLGMMDIYNQMASYS